MTGYRVTEYDEDHRGHPSFLVEAISPDPTEPALILVRRPGGSWDVYLSDGSPWPAGRFTPGDARIVAARKYRELDASGFYGSKDWRLSPNAFPSAMARLTRAWAGKGPHAFAPFGTRPPEDLYCRRCGQPRTALTFHP